MKRISIAVFLAIALSSCAAYDDMYGGAGVGGAGAAGAGNQGPIYAPPPQIQDPENTWDQARDIYADSAEDTRAKCERMAANESRNGAIVTCLGCVKMTKGERRAARYSCTLRVEATGR